MDFRAELRGGAGRKMPLNADKRLPRAASAGQLSAAVAIKSESNERDAKAAHLICFLAALPMTVRIDGCNPEQASVGVTTEAGLNSRG